MPATVTPRFGHNPKHPTSITRNSRRRPTAFNPSRNTSSNPRLPFRPNPPFSFRLHFPHTSATACQGAATSSMPLKPARSP